MAQLQVRLRCSAPAGSLRRTRTVVSALFAARDGGGPCVARVASSALLVLLGYQSTGRIVLVAERAPEVSLTTLPSALSCTRTSTSGGSVTVVRRNLVS